MKDKQNNKDFDQAFDDLFKQKRPINQQQKSEAIDEAMAAFSKQLAEDDYQQENTFQGYLDPARPIVKPATELWLTTIVKSFWSLFMKIPSSRFAVGTFASVAVAFIAFSFMLFGPGHIGKIGAPKIEHEPALPPTTQNNSVPEKTKNQKQLSPIVKLDRLDSTDKHYGTDLPTQEDVVSTAVKKFELSDKEIAHATELHSSQAQTNSLAQSPTRVKNHAELSALSAPAATKPSISKIARSTAAGTHYYEGPINEYRESDSEEYAEYEANSIKQVADEPVSTFSIDVDTASYSLVRNQLNSGFLPKPQAVRAEELINYFDYSYPIPISKKRPFETSISITNSPWNPARKLLHIGIKGYEIPAEQQPDSNLVFLLDVSGSMSAANKLPLVKQSIGLLLNTLKPSDTISIVVYAGAAGTVLEPTKISEKAKILSALQNLYAGGSTAGGDGIKLAYQLAQQNFNKNAVNRIILATDGDFNVGLQSNEDLKTLVERERDSGVFLSVLGFGRNNYQDDMMQTLAQNGNGVAAYIDTLSEAKKVLVDEASSTLFPIAKDVKIQIEFNPNTVSEYRLVGYETRHLNREDFNNDKVDAGDIGAGHTVTAIYEITPADANNKSVDQPRYAQNKPTALDGENSNEYGFLKIRYKLPNQTKSNLLKKPILLTTNEMDSEAHFSIAVAGFAQLLTHSDHTGTLSYDDVIKLASKHKGDDPFGYRSEFIQLVRMAKIARP